MSIQQQGVNFETAALLQRPDAGQVRFSDVFPEKVTEGEELWWRLTDYDSELSDEVGSAGFPSVYRVPIGYRPWLPQYGLVLVDDLVRDRNERIAETADQEDDDLHPDTLRERRAGKGAIIALANYAPRDETNTANGQNGSDFYLATTDAGLEIYATPLSALAGLEARNRITALYRIPTGDHPEFNGDLEQFRSGKVIRTRRHPGYPVPVFEYPSIEDLVAAKSSGNHPQVIPLDSRTGRIGHIDKFGNVVGELRDRRLLDSLEIGRTATLLVRDGRVEERFEVEVTTGFRAAPLGRLAVYVNCSGHEDVDSNTGLFEIISRVDENPSLSRETAIFKLLRHLPKLDPATVELELVA